MCCSWLFLPLAAAAEPWHPPLTDLAGRPLIPTSDPNLKALVVIFVLTDCPIGNSYLPELHRLYTAYKTQNIAFALIQSDPDTTAERAKEHAKEYKIEIPVVLDPRHAWVHKAGATTAPEAAVFSPTGDLLYRGRIDNQYPALGKRRAVVTEHNLKDALAAIVSGQPIKEPRTQAVGCLIPDLPRRQ